MCVPFSSSTSLCGDCSSGSSSRKVRAHARSRVCHGDVALVMRERDPRSGEARSRSAWRSGGQNSGRRWVSRSSNDGHGGARSGTTSACVSTSQSLAKIFRIGRHLQHIPLFGDGRGHVGCQCMRHRRYQGQLCDGRCKCGGDATVGGWLGSDCAPRSRRRRWHPRSKSSAI